MESKSVVVMVALVGLTVLAGGAAVAAVGSLKNNTVATQQVEDFGFPGDSIRTAKTVPHFELTNQVGEKITLEQLRGKVVVLTAVYATCHTACPTIITQAKSAVNKLTPAQRDQVAIVAITLDPEGDTLTKRAATAKSHNLDAPLFNYVNGDDPAAVLKLVADLGWARAEAGGDSDVIGHSNLFMLVDRKGKIAFTISADTQVNWLDDALQLLLAES